MAVARPDDRTGDARRAAVSPATHAPVIPDQGSRRPLTRSESARDLQRRLQVLVSAMPDMMFVVSSDGRFLEAKPAAEDPFLMLPEEFLGKHLTEILPPDVSEPALAAVSDAIAAGGIPTFEYRLTMPAGEQFYEARAIAVAADEVVLTVRNMTRRHRLESQLEMQSEVLTRLAQGIWLVRSDDGTIVWANDQMNDILGYARGDLIGRDLLSLSAMTDPVHELAAVRSGLAAATSWHGDLAARHADGRLVWLSVSASRYDHPEFGEVFIGVHTDITQRKLAEDDLATLFDLSPDMLVLADFTGFFIRMNDRAWQESLGWTGEELRAVPFLDFVHEDDRASTVEVFETLIGGDAVLDFENRYRAADGSYRWLHWRSRPVPGREVVVAIARDVTEAKREHRRERVIAEINGVSGGARMDLADLADQVTAIVDTNIGGHSALVLPGDGDRPTTIVGDPRRFVRIPAPEVVAAVQETDRPVLDGDQMCVPMSVRGEVIALLVARGNGGDVLSDDLDLVEEIAQLISATVENAKLNRNLAEAAELLSALATGIVKLGLDGAVLAWYPGAERIGGWSSAEMVGRDVESLLTPEGWGLWRSAFDGLVATREPRLVEVQARTSEGISFWAEISLAPVRDWHGEIEAVVANFADVSDRRAAQEALEVVARSDALTGVANRAEFERMLRKALRRSKSDGAGGALIYVDLDGFKETNDTFGHQVGDEVLREVGSRLRSAAGVIASTGRFGGDEFGMLVEFDGAGEGSDLMVAGRVLASLALPYESMGHLIELDASCGIARFPQDATDLDTLMFRADAAMYAAKSRGGGHTELYRPGLETVLVDRSAEVFAVRRGIQNREFVLHHQPVVSLDTSEVVGFEALARWNSKGGLLLPGEFLPVAEDSGAIIPLGYQLIEMACEQFSGRLDGRDGLLDVWVNLSRRQFAADDLVPRLEGILHRYSVDPRRLTIEITETTLFDEPEQAAGTLQALKSLGVRIALDDFGTGYSSLGALSELPVDIVKIDSMFVSRLGSSQSSPDPQRAIVQAAIQMSHALGLTVVAEGVETAGQRDTLRGLACDLGQGYLFGRPSPDWSNLETGFR